ncbi:hypothetical protein BC829DRAFT_384489 [Chytridium lagenaria]|nr:hypothetical protein BC829DRAFT_384489 [Chytridium lagenaria]
MKGKDLNILRDPKDDKEVKGNVVKEGMKGKDLNILRDPKDDTEEVKVLTPAKAAEMVKDALKIKDPKPDGKEPMKGKDLNVMKFTHDDNISLEDNYAKMKAEEEAEDARIAKDMKAVKDLKVIKAKDVQKLAGDVLPVKDDHHHDHKDTPPQNLARRDQRNGEPPQVSKSTVVRIPSILADPPIDAWYVTRNSRLLDRPTTSTPDTLLSYASTAGFAITRVTRTGKPYGTSGTPADISTFTCYDLIDHRSDELFGDTVLAVRFESEMFSLSTDDDVGVEVSSFPLKSLGVPDGFPTRVFGVFEGMVKEERRKWEEVEGRKRVGGVVVGVAVMGLLPVLLVGRGEEGGFLVKRGDRLRYKVYKSLKGSV